MAAHQTFGFLYIGGGFGLLGAAKALEFQGDLAAAPGDRLTFHGLALVVTVGALACFVRGGIVAFRALRRRATPDAELTRIFAEEESFDADAVMARYLENRPVDAPSSSPPSSPAPPRGASFGRKRV